MATETKKTELAEEPGDAPGADEQTDHSARDDRDEQDGRGDKARGADSSATLDKDTRADLDDDEAYGADDAADRDDADRGRDGDAGTAAGRGAGMGAIAAAVVSAGLGLVSLSGNPLSDMLREHKQVVGQVQGAKGGSGASADQIKTLYSAPWHTAALGNAVLALIAVVVGGILLARLSRNPETRGWIKGVALGGVALGVIGILMAGGMYLDLFGHWPSMPPMPQQPQQPGM